MNFRLPWLRHLSRRPVMSGAVLFVMAFASAAIASAITGIPQPYIHDEFSYLLAGDTFSQFRLVNPTHPMWVFFESMHIVHEPSYASMYPPGQGMSLAIGFWLGQPIVGVWLGMAALSVAVYWMLLAWMPSRWALLGGSLVVLKWIVLGRAAPMAVAGYWSQSYYGGAVQAIGGALLFGGLARIVGVRRSTTKASVYNALIMTFGVAMLANTRPFEGMMLSLPAAVLVLAWLIRQRGPQLKAAMLRVVVPAGIVVVLMFAFMLTYNKAVTGKATKIPWQHHHEQYCTFPVFLFQQPVDPPTWNHAELEQMHGVWELSLWEKHRSAEGMVRLTGRKVVNLWVFFVAPLPRLGLPIEETPQWAASTPAAYLFDWFKGISAIELTLAVVLTLPLIFLVRLRRLKWTLFIAACAAVVVLGNLMTVLAAPHYAAPATCLFTFVIVQSLRAARVSCGRWGRRLFTACMVISIASYLYGFVPSAREGAKTWFKHRAAAIETLEQADGQHLVIVRYGPKHSIHNEWVFNAADIDASKIVWARDMGDEKNKPLLDYFKGRTIWRLYVNEDDVEQKLELVGTNASD